MCCGEKRQKKNNSNNNNNDDKMGHLPFKSLCFECFLEGGCILLPRERRKSVDQLIICF